MKEQEIKEPVFENETKEIQDDKAEIKKGKKRSKKETETQTENKEVDTKEKRSKYKIKSESINIEADLILANLNGIKNHLKNEDLNPVMMGIFKNSYVEVCKKHNIGLMAKPELVLLFVSGVLIVDCIPQDKASDIFAVAKNRIGGMFKRGK